MRVLLTTYPEKSFLQAMVPLAWALRTAGHDVRVASQPELIDTITQAGLTAVSVGRNRGIWRVAELDPESREAEREGLPDPYNAAVLDPQELSWEAMRDGYQHHVEHWHRFDNFPMIADLVEFARSWQPDLVLWEPTTYAGPIAARACGAAHGRLLWSIDVFGVTRERYLRLNEQRPAGHRADPLGTWLESYARKYGFDFGEDLVTGQFTIDQLPDSLRMEAGSLEYLPVQYVPYGGAAVVPRWLWTEPERPRVALTLGITATNRFSGYVVGVREILESLADLDVEVVATIAESEQSKLGTVPGNARVVSYVPLHALVPTCSAVIHHAGPGTLLTTALGAVPQVCLPWDFDEPELAGRLAAQGSATTILADQATGPVVREHVRRLLDDPAFGQRARAMRDEIRALPSPNALVPRLEQLTDKYRAAGR
ncbi:activator-dependent family glycosyltransferase [Streptomyces sp. AK010]|uniref:activator-dependent family glycosyltransferase n=1 Tax=Streptomyces sp. AK010 TaxID=2723074 RepID=UPI00160A09CE|nr:activator-dependent family glycosyltransferase [Streptomyces sp. AK010]MBB6421388.1 glycosyltransferase (activator-dependent family) [Streptomyces sp. AK010]